MPADEAPKLTYAECDRDEDGVPGWKMERADLDELVAYCPACWQREFGDDPG